MRAYLILPCILLAAPSGRAEPTTGSVTGRVIVVDNGEEIDPGDAPAFVYLVELERKHRKDRFGDAVTRTIEHRLNQFKPHVVVVPVGATVLFPNFDHDTHNAFSPSPKNAFDLGQYGYTGS